MHERPLFSHSPHAGVLPSHFRWRWRHVRLRSGVSGYRFCCQRADSPSGRCAQSPTARLPLLAAAARLVHRGVRNAGDFFSLGLVTRLEDAYQAEQFLSWAMRGWQTQSVCPQLARVEDQKMRARASWPTVKCTATDGPELAIQVRPEGGANPDGHPRHGLYFHRHPLHIEF